MRKLKLKKVMLFAQSAISANWRRWDSGSRRTTKQQRAGGSGQEWPATCLDKQQYEYQELKNKEQRLPEPWILCVLAALEVYQRLGSPCFLKRHVWLRWESWVISKMTPSNYPPFADEKTKSQRGKVTKKLGRSCCRTKRKGQCLKTQKSGKKAGKKSAAGESPGQWKEVKQAEPKEQKGLGVVVRNTLVLLCCSTLGKTLLWLSPVKWSDSERIKHL